MLSKPSGSSDERTLRRVVKCVMMGTHSTTEAILAEPLLNSQVGAERSSYFRKVKRHVTKIEAQAAQQAAAGTSAAFMVAAQKAASTVTAAAAATVTALAAAHKAPRQSPLVGPGHVPVEGALSSDQRRPSRVHGRAFWLARWAAWNSNSN